MMLSLESLAYKADDAGGEFNAAQREVRCQRRTIKAKSHNQFLNFRFNVERSRLTATARGSMFWPTKSR